MFNISVFNGSGRESPQYSQEPQGASLGSPASTTAPDNIMTLKNLHSSTFIPGTNPRFATHQEKWFAELGTKEQRETRPLITENTMSG
jgi:hypothetical protein